MLTYAGAKYDPEGQGELIVVGLPSDLGADTRAGQGNAPTHIRYHAIMPVGVFPYVPYGGVVVDAGDVVPITRDNAYYLDDVRTNISELADDGSIVLALGGDDSVTYGVVMGLVDVFEQVGVLHYDAHVDMDMDDNIGIDHSNWVTRASEYAPFKQRFCREVSMSMPLDQDIPDDAPLLIAVDMDVFDPAFASGVAVPVPFGPTPQNVLADILTQIGDRPVVGICITEVLPERDVDGRTAVLASYLVNRILSYLWQRKTS